jgi:hypothetical protein
VSLRRIQADEHLALTPHIALYDDGVKVADCTGYDLDRGWYDVLKKDERGRIVLGLEMDAPCTERRYSRKLRAVYDDGRMRTEEMGLR